MRFELVAWTIALKVPLEQGQMTMPLVRNDPLATGADVITVMMVAEDPRFANSHREHVARLRGDSRQGTDLLEFGVVYARRAEEESRGVEMLQIDVEVVFLFDYRLRGRTDRQMDVTTCRQQYFQQADSVRARHSLP